MRGIAKTAPAILPFLRAAIPLAALLAAPAHAGDWVAAWTAAPFPATPVLTAQDVRDYDGATVRQHLVVNAAGTRLRVRMTNALGTAPLAFASASVEIGGRTMPLRFGGRDGAILPPGASLASDPLPVAVSAFQTIAIDVRYPPHALPAAHLLPVSVRYPDGHTRTGRGPALAAMVEVDRPRPGRVPSRVIVAIGDSITEGARDKAESFTGWPELFAARLATIPAHRGWSVVNAGIHGNRLLRDGAGPNVLARFDRDVLAVSGVTDVIVLAGINDLGWGNAKPATDGPVAARDLIAGYRQVIDRAHAAGLRIVGATIPPYRGSVYFTPSGEAVRAEVNRWISTSTAFDAVIDFAAVMADRRDPTRLDPAKESGDHLHPATTGYMAMAAAIDPRVFVRP